MRWRVSRKLGSCASHSPTLQPVASSRGTRSTQRAEAARAEVINIVNNFFYEKMTGMPKIKDYLERQGASWEKR